MDINKIQSLLDTHLKREKNIEQQTADSIDVQWIKGIGPKRAKALNSIGIFTAKDLIYYFPRRYLDRSTIVPFQKMYDYVDQVVTGVGTVVSVIMTKSKKPRLIVTLNDVRGVMECIFFQGLNYWSKAFDVGEVIAVSGKVNVYGKKPSIIHPDIDRLSDEDSIEFINTGGIIPVYPSSSELEKVGLNRHGGFRKIIRGVLDQYLKTIEEFLPDTIQANHSFMSLEDALNAIHFPHTHELLHRAQERLKFDEFFLLQLQLAFKKHLNSTAQPGISFNIQSPHARRLVDSLPFQLTSAQKKVLKEIAGDMQSSKPMNRLLQGDVGSGKTVVALLVMLVAIDNGYQTVFMVPTEILAEQHYRRLTSLINSHNGINDYGVSIELLIGQQAQSKRKRIIENVANGEVHIVVGTHALIQKDVHFSNLGLIVIDEQHRFGVMQRAVLREKGIAPDVLVMTATPIPRTLAMTLYGDLNVSIIDEMPKHRKPVKTVVRFEEDRIKVYNFIRSEVHRKHQVFIVFPLVEESEKIDLKAATMEYENLSTKIFQDLRIGLLHGQMNTKEKDEVMMKFKNGQIDLLVTTTVIEVGIDIPQATVMMIEHAERFGLSQLHQLRGRVGRGVDQSYCILMTDRNIFYTGRKITEDEKVILSATRTRLETMKRTNDGFKIADVDMQIRGPGDLWGTQQHGFPELKIANIVTDGAILMDARKEAFHIVEIDPQLRLGEHQQLRKTIEPMIKERINLAEVG